jgi:hypothetical protein
MKRRTLLALVLALCACVSPLKADTADNLRTYTTVVPLTLVNGWTNIGVYAGGYDNELGSVYKDRGRVYLAGCIGGIGNNNTFTWLPNGMRPAKITRMPGVFFSHNATITGDIVVFPNGGICDNTPIGTNPLSFIHMNSSFLAASNPFNLYENPAAPGVQLYVPDNVPASTKLIVYVHEFGNARYAPVTYDTGFTNIQAMLNQGWIVLACDAAGDAWGNQASLDAYSSAIAWVQSQYAFSETDLYGVSMGGIPGLLLTAQHADIQKFYGVFPCCNLSNVYTSTVYPNAVKTAYGFSDSSQYAVATAGHDPVLLDPVLFTGKKIRLVASPSDTNIVKSQNTDLVFSLFGSTATVTVLPATGNHGDPSHFVPADVVNFFTGE